MAAVHETGPLTVAVVGRGGWQGLVIGGLSQQGVLEGRQS